jgi:hypothetical protein
VCLDVSIRWSSTYLMFDKLEDTNAAYKDFFDDDDSPPSNFDWENVRAFVKFLKYVYEATKVFSVSTQNRLRPPFYQFKAMEFDEEYEICAETLNNTALIFFNVNFSYNFVCKIILTILKIHHRIVWKFSWKWEAFFLSISITTV